MATTAEALAQPRARLGFRLLVLLPALWLALFAGIGSVPLFDVDEGAFSEASLEMIASGNYAVTTLNGEPRYDKPMLAYWLQAASVKLFGVHEFAFRLPSALAALLWAGLIWRFARRRFGADAADASVLIFAGTLGVALIGRAATADALLNLCLAGIAFSIFDYAEDGRRRDLYLGFLWMGLGVLTKGPIAIALPLLASLIYFISRRRWRDALRAYGSPVGWLILIAIVLPWAYANYRSEGWDFFRGFLLEHNLGRYTDTMEGHGGRLGYYIPVLMLILLPWTALFMRNLSFVKQQFADPYDRWAWVWLATAFVIFSLSATQLPHYILYGCTPILVLMARHRDSLISATRPSVPPLTTLSLFLLLPHLLPLFIARLGEREQAMLSLAPAGFTTEYHLILGVAIVGILAVAVLRRLPPWPSLACTGVLYLGAISLAVIPAWGRIQQAPVREAAHLAAALGGPTVVVGLDVPSFSVYRGASTPRRDPQAGELALVRSDRLAALRRELAPLHLRELYRNGAVVLVKTEF